MVIDHEGISVLEPLVASVPDHAPYAVQDVVFVELHASVVELPTVMVEGDAMIMAVGGAGGVAVTVTAALPVFVASCVDVAEHTDSNPSSIRTKVFLMDRLLMEAKYLTIIGCSSEDHAVASARSRLASTNRCTMSQTRAASASSMA